MFRIVVLNPKGGSGKTTLAVNLASHFSQQGKITTLMDLDPQAASVYWAHCRPEQQSEIQLVDAHNCSARVTRSWAIQPPRNTEVLVVDTPARPDMHTIQPLLADAAAIVIPVLPSEFDLHTAANFVTKLSCSQSSRHKISIVANRVRGRPSGYNKLKKLFADKNIPVIATLRDTQNYGAAAEQGMGILEMKGCSYARDKQDFLKLTRWCEELLQKPTNAIRPMSPSQYIGLTSIA